MVMLQLYTTEHVTVYSDNNKQIINLPLVHAASPGPLSKHYGSINPLTPQHIHPPNIYLSIYVHGTAVSQCCVMVR